MVYFPESTMCNQKEHVFCSCWLEHYIYLGILGRIGCRLLAPVFGSSRVDNHITLDPCVIQVLSHREKPVDINDYITSGIIVKSVTLTASDTKGVMTDLIDSWTTLNWSKGIYDFITDPDTDLQWIKLLVSAGCEVKFYNPTDSFKV